MTKSGILSGLRIIEGSAFVAAPLGGLVLAQLGAEVIRFDQIGGGLDYRRWPVTKTKKSLFWSGLNKGKKSIQIDIRSEAGRQLAKDLITAEGNEAGIFLTNFPTNGWLNYADLSARRKDLIMVSLRGNHDGSSEVDYTVNPAMGFPAITGPENSTEPINSVLPTWDLVLGNMAAVSVLAAERHRTRTNEGEFVSIALSDVALSVVSALGRLAQAHLQEEVPIKDGNYLYGAFGHNFMTKDGREIMIVALTLKQWQSLKIATNLEKELTALEVQEETDLDDEANRYRYRKEICNIIESWIEARDYHDVREILIKNFVSWGPYQTFGELLERDPRASSNNPIFELIELDGVGKLPTVSSPIRFQNNVNLSALRSPNLGDNTDEVLEKLLKLSDWEIAKLHDKGVVA